MASRASVRMVGHHKLGNKKIFIPDFVIKLLRTPEQSPFFASFMVPLNINKLDLRDYLWHAYGVQVRGVRSYILQQKIQQDRPGAIRVSPRRWHRPRAIKKMLVELEKPFVWPSEPEDLELWDKGIHDEVRKEQEEAGPPREKPSSEIEDIKLQAEALRSGQASWNTKVPQESEWVEVEQGFGVEPKAGEK